MRRAEGSVVAILFLAGGLHCLWRGLRAAISGRWDSRTRGIPVRYERDAAPGRFAFAVAAEFWFGLMGLLLAFWCAHGFPKPYDHFVLGVFLLPMGPLFLGRAVHGFFTGRIEYSERAAPTRRYLWSRNPGSYLLAFFANLFFGAIASFFTWWCFH